MGKRFLMGVLSALIVAGTIGFANASNWKWNDGNGNTHTYSVIEGTMTWQEAYDSLEEGTYLATITSQEEQNAMFDALSGLTGELNALTGEYWLGGIQIPGSTVDENWSWQDTGESFCYTSWAEGKNEPNDWNDIDEIHIGTWSKYGWEWNDEHGSANIVGYIIETGVAYDDCSPVPEPATMMLFGIGLLGLAGVSRRKK